MIVATERLSILLLVRSLDVGGAERQLVLLARGLKARGQRVVVAVFYNRGALRGELERAGVPIIDLRKRGRWDLFPFSVRTMRAIRDFGPDVIYSFLGGANLIAALARPFMLPTKLVWSIRASDMDLSKYDWLQGVGYAVERRLARKADLIIANSHAGSRIAIANGFPARTVMVVPNGIDTTRFRPDAQLRHTQRAIWEVTKSETLIGVLARLDPMKGHEVFLRAAVEVTAQRADARLVCIGDGTESVRLEALAADLGVGSKVMFVGSTNEPVAALNALDIYCSPSLSEGFSNAIAEAMACGLPCVVTNVGDSAVIVGERGNVVAPCEPSALAKAILRSVQDLDGVDQKQLRTRVIENFSADAMVDQTLELLRRVCSGN